MKRNRYARWPRMLALLAVGVLWALPMQADDWMKRLPDDAFISQVSIPGVHDAGTGHGFGGWIGSMFGESCARTQDKTLAELWDTGVRAFDLRPAVDGTSLPIYHGIIETKLDMSTALTTLCSLLDQHPTEMAIVIVRHETEGDDNSSDWNSLMKELINSEPVKSHTVNFTPNMKMQSARGKLLILSRDKYATTPTGGFITNWSSSTVLSEQQNGRITGPSSNATCYIQDYYDCTADNGKTTKWNTIRTLLRFTAEQNTSNRIWAINYTSGYSQTIDIFGNAVSSSDGYRDNAAAQNAAMVEWLDEHSGPTGIVMMDYAGVDNSNGYAVQGYALTQALIENNFRQSEYAAAVEQITSGKKYQVFTELQGQKYYLTQTGYLTAALSEAASFTFRKVKGEEFGYGFKLASAYFTNPGLDNGQVILHSGHINTTNQTRDTWEAQVFLLNADGRYAIRATNAAGGESSWALTAKTYWAVNTTANGPVAEYSFEKCYVWQIQEPKIETRTEQIVSSGSEKQDWFDLSGRRVEQPQKGIYIHGNKKVIIK